MQCALEHGAKKALHAECAVAGSIANAKIARARCVSAFCPLRRALAGHEGADNERFRKLKLRVAFGQPCFHRGEDLSMLRVDRQRECTCLDLSWTHELSERSRALVIAATTTVPAEDRTTHPTRTREPRHGKRRWDWTQE